MRLFGVALNGKVALYYFVFITALMLFLIMMRIVASHLGSVLQAIRENEMRAEAIGYRVFYRTAIFCIAAGVAACAGVLWAVWLKYTGPEVVLSFDIIDRHPDRRHGNHVRSRHRLGRGDAAQYYLKDLMALGAEVTASLPVIPDLLNPHRWLLWWASASSCWSISSPPGLPAPSWARTGTSERARSTYLDAAGFEMHVTEWGERSNPALVMWHGLARTGRDFDEAAAALSGRYFVLCPDTLGRGLSAWSPRGAADYTFATYGDMASAMLDHYRIERLGWIGTSMGGLLGIKLAAGLLRDRLTHLVINDVGPDMPEGSARRIAEYVGNPPVFGTVGEYEGWLRRTYAPFGWNTDLFWRRMVDTSLRRTADGRITVHYDPTIVSLMTENSSDLDLWDAYDSLAVSTLLLRGESSDVLPAASPPR